MTREEASSEEVASLGRFLDEQLGDHSDLTLTPMLGGGSCEIFAVDRGSARWVLRRAPRHASSATAHDVLREFKILDAIKDQRVRIARPIVACDDPEVLGSPFYVMERVDGVPIRNNVPEGWAAAPDTHIVRRGGEVLARRASQLAAEALSAGGTRSEAGRVSISAMDASLRDSRKAEGALGPQAMPGWPRVTLSLLLLLHLFAVFVGPWAMPPGSKGRLLVRATDSTPATSFTRRKTSVCMS